MRKFSLDGDMDEPFDKAVSDILACALEKSFTSCSAEYTELIQIAGRALRLATVIATDKVEK